MVEILQKENPKLRAKSTDVPIAEIDSRRLNAIIAEMTEALESQDDAVAIAAPQLGYNIRLFIISRRVFEMASRGGKPPKADKVFINPKILKLSREKEESEEGCLSVRYLYGKVKRSKKATVEALDEKGNKFISGGSGIIAQIFQHEVDHLDGILFTDKARDLQEILPEKIEK